MSGRADRLRHLLRHSIAVGNPELFPMASTVPVPAIVRNVVSLSPPVMISLPPLATVMVRPPEKFKLPSIVVVPLPSVTLTSPPMLAASAGTAPIFSLLAVAKVTEPRFRVPQRAQGTTGWKRQRAAECRIALDRQRCTGSNVNRC